jgi:hypothetical protein
VTDLIALLSTLLSPFAADPGDVASVYGGIVGIFA